MTPETLGYLIGFGTGLFAMYRLGRAGYRRLRA
jgi:hypothetical protein